ncbi:thioesterase II family protein [Roseibium sp.]
MRWQKDLATHLHIVPVALPGRSTRLDDKIPASLETMVEELFEAMIPMTVSPYAILGSSMGGWLAYELCRRIEAHNLARPVAVFVITSPPPHAERILPELDPGNIDFTLEQLIAFNPANGILREYPELQEVLLPTILADFNLCRRYRLERPIPIGTPLVAVSANLDTIVPAKLMSDWGEYTIGKFQHFELPGDHALIENPPPQLFQALRSQLGVSRLAP